MMPLLLQATQPADDPWSQLRTALIGAALLVIAAGAALIVKWLNSLSNKLTDVSATATAADAKSDVNSLRITNTANHVREVDGKQTDLAEKVGQATTTANAAKQAAEQPRGNNP